MKLSFATLDVFTNTRYQGNPLAVILLPHTTGPPRALLTQRQKQLIAAEFNLSETVFLHLPPPEITPSPPTSPSTNTTSSALTPFTPCHIDIFTTAAEVPFAGHPSVGAAWYFHRVLRLRVTGLITKAGRLQISSDSPLTSPTNNTTTNPPPISVTVPQTFHIHAHRVPCPALTGPAKLHPIVSIVKGMTFILVEVPSLEVLARAKESGNLNPGGMYAHQGGWLDEGWGEGLVVTMYYLGVGEGVGEGKERHYRTRMLCSFDEEDAGTGSASCALGCWLAREGAGRGVGVGAGKERFVFEQGVEMGRRNVIRVDVEGGFEGGDGSGSGSGSVYEVKSVVLSGTAVVVMEGSVEVPDL